MSIEDACKCIKIEGHLEDIVWFSPPQKNKRSVWPLSLEDWTRNPHIWLYYVESANDLLQEDDVLNTFHFFALVSRQSTALSSATQHAMPPEFSRKWGTECLNTRFPLPLYAGYRVKQIFFKSTQTKYWSIHDVQRYFLGDLHCEQVLFTYQYPNLKLASCLGNHLWSANTALKLSSSVYMKELHTSIETSLKKAVAEQIQVDRLIVSDQLIKIDQLDYFKRKTFLKLLHNFIGLQDSLQLVSLENLGCKRLEGVQIIQNLASFASHSLKYLFLWRFFLSNENPILVNYSYITGSGEYLPRPDTKQCFLRSLGELRNLRILALEYAHIADGSGNALLSLLPVIRRPHFRLQLICREDQTPGRASPHLGVGGREVPDTAWRRVSVTCPDLYLFMAFFLIRDYDHVQRFLAPSMPLREVHLQHGIFLGFAQRQDSDISCFVRLIAYRYASSLVTLSIHQWRSPHISLRRVIEIMPHLTRLVYTGRINCKDLHKALIMLACGVCDKLKHLHIQIQDDATKTNYWRKVAARLKEEFEQIMQFYNINFVVEIYKS